MAGDRWLEGGRVGSGKVGFADEVAAVGRGVAVEVEGLV
jgi:hypothetical protein